MFNKSIVEKKLLGLVGFNASLNPDFFALDSDNLDSRSGYKFNNTPYADLESLRDTQNYADIDSVQFNELLRTLNKNAITSVANAVFTTSATPSFIDRQKVYKYALNKANLETGLVNGFVGRRFCFENKPNVTAEITEVTLDFSGTGNLTLLLYNTQSLQPVEQKTVTIVGDNQKEVLNWKMHSQNGDYYIGYVYDGSLVPYKRSYELSNIESRITYLSHEKKIVKDFTGGNIWDLQTEGTTSSATGMNLDVSVYHDYTDLIIQNETLFANAIFLEGSISFLNYIRSSLRSNKNQRLSENNLILLNQTIEGQEGQSVVRITGLRPSLNEQIGLIQQRVNELRKGFFTGRIKTMTLR
jgi:hypothetical protein